jgi:hypothetical protein
MLSVTFIVPLKLAVVQSNAGARPRWSAPRMSESSNTHDVELTGSIGIEPLYARVSFEKMLTP